MTWDQFIFVNVEEQLENTRCKLMGRCEQLYIYKIRKIGELQLLNRRRVKGCDWLQVEMKAFNTVSHDKNDEVLTREVDTEMHWKLNEL